MAIDRQQAWELLTKYNEEPLTISYDHNGTLLTWTKVDKATSYILFIAESDKVSLNLMDNDCYLNEIYQKWADSNGTLPTGFILILDFIS